MTERSDLMVERDGIGWWTNWNQQAAVVSQSEWVLTRTTRECGLCGLSRGEVATMIQNILTSRLTREQQIELYESTAKDGDALAPCLPCVEAVLDLTDEMKEDMP